MTKDFFDYLVLYNLKMIEKFVIILYIITYIIIYLFLNTMV